MIINRLAIIGLGSIGRRHLRLLSEISPDIEIIVVRSGYGSECEEEKMASKTLHSISEAIKYGIQAAIVSSPTILHLEQSLELAKNGVHLLIEKPFLSSHHSATFICHGRSISQPSKRNRNRQQRIIVFS